MLFCLTRDAFVRSFGDVGYITNQLTRRDRVYDVNGKMFLERLKRTPKPIASIVRELKEIYPAAQPDELERDFIEFAANLENEGLDCQAKCNREYLLKKTSLGV